MPILVMASGYKLLKGKDDISTITGGGAALIVGSVAAFITALFAIKWLLKYVAHHDFRPFAYYRIALGLLLIMLFISGVFSN
jgi:undecaprenyl-diphosphatase